MASAPNIESFEQAIKRLQEILIRYESNPSDDHIRDGLIQRFEFVYELSPKMIKRFLEYTADEPDQVNLMPFPSLIRTANQHGLLLGEYRDWEGYRKLRGKTSHTYNEEIAISVVAEIPKFLEEAIHLRDELRERL